jgi:predicted GNAT family acetyltransferase
MSEAMHVLESVVDPPRPASGRLRVATAADRELMIAWLVAFEEEAGVGRDPSRRAAAIDAALASGALLVWEDGAPVCMVGVSPRVAGAVRVGPVYTPPEQRARGYASSAVAAASRRALGQGADQCMLFTDLANPTSNKIYADVGYRRFGEWEEHLFERA